MYMRWLKYVRLNRKDRLKNMRGTTLEVTMLADVKGRSQITPGARTVSKLHDSNSRFYSPHGSQN